MTISIQTNESAIALQHTEEIEQLQDRVATLEELLLVYEQSATERENHLQEVWRKSEDKALQLEHAQSALETVKAILNSMGDAVVVIDNEGHTLFNNPAAVELIEADFLSSPFADQSFALEQVTDGSACLFPQAATLKAAILDQSIDSLEMHIAKQNRWLSINARPLEANGQITGAVSVFRDITLAKQVAQALQQSNAEFRQQSQVLADTLQELKQAQAMLIHKEKMSSLGQTIAGIAHEINNPLSFIHGNIELARQTFHDLLDLIQTYRQACPMATPAIEEALESVDLDFVSADIPRMLASMRCGTQRIREIVQSMRVFSHLDESAVKAVDIHAGIDSACLVIQSQLEVQKDSGAIGSSVIALRKDYGSLPLLECHASQLNQVFVHLLSNAIYALKARAAAGQAAVTSTAEQTSVKEQASPLEIVIRTEAHADRIVIRFLDNGIGIPESVQSKIFDPFFTTKPVGKGTGLGLSVCHQIIVDVHQGSIECTSQAGIGTEFAIALPRTPIGHSFGTPYKEKA